MPAHYPFKDVEAKWQARWRESGLYHTPAEPKDKYYVLVGGAPVTQAWADEIGADGFAHDAFDAVQVLDKAMEGRAK